MKLVIYINTIYISIKESNCIVNNFTIIIVHNTVRFLLIETRDTGENFYKELKFKGETSTMDHY